MTPCTSLESMGSRHELCCERTHQSFNALLRHFRQPGGEIARICDWLDIIEVLLDAVRLEGAVPNVHLIDGSERQKLQICNNALQRARRSLHAGLQLKAILIKFYYLTSPCLHTP